MIASRALSAPAHGALRALKAPAGKEGQLFERHLKAFDFLGQFALHFLDLLPDLRYRRWLFLRSRTAFAGHVLLLNRELEMVILTLRFGPVTRSVGECSDELDRSQGVRDS